MSLQRREPPWIPPGALVIGGLSQGLSWLLLLALALRGEDSLGPHTLAWIHLVALGWLTMVALAILIFAAPNFTDATLRGERLARFALYPFALGAYLMVAGFLAERFAAVAWGAAILAASLALYLLPMLAALGVAAARAPRTERAIARALSGVLVMLAAAAALGVVMALALALGVAHGVLTRGPAIHAHLAGVGWLTILIFGISMQTLGPIAGRRPARRWRHITLGILALLGVLVVSAALAAASGALLWIGALSIACAVVLYLFDLFEALAGARNPHRPPQAFLAAAGLWLALAVALGLGVVAGARWQNAYVYVALVGWLGQIVNGHLHHIPVRLMATMVRGEQDETDPAEVLSAPLSWLAWALAQLAVACGAAALLAGATPLLAFAALCGLAGWCAMLLNASSAYRRLSVPRSTISLL
ncbi:MAG: hypothetical protein KGM44_10020 [bacterium]|nr:hypothetical protein [bacterium]